MFHHVPLVMMSVPRGVEEEGGGGGGGGDRLRPPGPFSADVCREPPGCANGDHKETEMTNVAVRKH